MEYKRRAAYIATTPDNATMSHVLCEEKVWGSAGGTEGKLKVRVTDLQKLSNV